MPEQETQLNILQRKIAECAMQNRTAIDEVIEASADPMLDEADQAKLAKLPEESQEAARKVLASRNMLKKVMPLLLGGMHPPKIRQKLIQEGLDAEIIDETIDNCTEDPDYIALGGTKLKAVSPAKAANRLPFSNFRYGMKPGGKEPKRGQIPIHINELVQEIFKRFKGFPCRVGNSLFDHDEKTDRIREIRCQDELFSWIQEKSKHHVDWAYRLQGAVSKGELFVQLMAVAKEYKMIAAVPTWPYRDDVYYTCREMPDPTPDAKYFNDFCFFFNPATSEDMELIRCLIASPLYYRPKVDRPLWVIDSEQGPGAGKTKLAEMIALLYGGDDMESSEPFWVSHDEFQRDADRVFRRILSINGRRKRIFLLDNVTGYFHSDVLSTFVTQGSISGIAPYGKSEETRTNDLTYIITSNSATISHDLAVRSQFINLSHPDDPSEDWPNMVGAYIKKHRMQIISDIMGILERGCDFEMSVSSRFRMWQKEVMGPILGDEGVYSDVWKKNKDQQTNSDGEADEAETIVDAFVEEFRAIGFDPETYAFWIEAKVLQYIAQKAIPGFGGKTGRNSRHKLVNMIKVGMLGKMSSPVKKFPAHRGKTGLAWNWDLFDSAKAIGKFRVLRMQGQDQIIAKTEA